MALGWDHYRGLQWEYGTMLMAMAGILEVMPKHMMGMDTASQQTPTHMLYATVILKQVMSPIFPR